MLREALERFDRDPTLAGEALKRSPDAEQRLHERLTGVLTHIALVLEAADGPRAADEHSSPLASEEGVCTFTSEEAICAAGSLLERRLRDPDPRVPLDALVEPLMAILALAHGGPAASARELAASSPAEP